MITPLLEQLTVLIATGLEVIKGKFTLKITEYNKRISDIEAGETIIANPIGFTLPEEEDDYDEED